MGEIDRKLEDVEVQLAHMGKTVDELNDVVTRQSSEIARLQKLVKLLLERAAEDEAGATGAPPANQRPPHW